VLGGRQKLRQDADRLQDFESSGLDPGGARLAVHLNIALDEPGFHAMAGKLGGGKQPGRARSDD
jgi:hypothetical protein